MTLLTGKLENDLETVFDFFSKNRATSYAEAAEIERAKHQALDLVSLVGESNEVCDLPPEHPLFAFENVRPRENDHPAFILMFEIARSLPMRDHVKDVTFHDRNALRRVSPEETFGWFLRPTGSTILWQGDRASLGTLESASAEGGAYWWNGTTLKKLVPAQVKWLLDQPPPRGVPSRA